jgi:flagellin-like protein
MSLRIGYMSYTNNKIDFYFEMKGPINHIKTKHSAVSEIIATLMLLAITVVGAVMISVLMQGSLGGLGTDFTSTYLESQQVPSIKLTGYDTRDGLVLYGIKAINNTQNSELCTKGCDTANANNYPNLGGTEFIVLRIKNEGTNSFTVDDVVINDIDHLWDSTKTGILSSSNYPNAGKFVIVSYVSPLPNPVTISSSNVLSSGDQVLLVMKLSKDIAMTGGAQQPDISYNIPLSVELTGSLNAPSFTILSGDAM